MKQILGITNSPYQQMNVTLSGGATLTMIIRFAPMQLGWFIQEIDYINFKTEGFRICNSPNMLRQFKNQIPFGMACFSTNDREPSLIDDFSSQDSVLYILSSAEVLAYEAFLSA